MNEIMFGALLIVATIHGYFARQAIRENLMKALELQGVMAELVRWQGLRIRGLEEREEWKEKKKVVECVDDSQ